LECDYDTCPTKLYQAVEEKKWEDIAFFLDTGSWNNTLWLACGGIFGGNDHDPPSIQARTWVTALDSSTGQVRWCQLPLHAAITFQAPLYIIQKLLTVYPKSARCADDQGLLPLHYAFRFGAADEVIWDVLQAFPQAIRKKAARDRLPLDLSPFSTKPERGYIIERFVESAVKSAKEEWDHESSELQRQQQEQLQQQQDDEDNEDDELRQQQRGNAVHQELGRRLYQKSQKLNLAMKQLKQTQMQLDQLRKELKTTFTPTITTRTNPLTPTTTPRRRNNSATASAMPFASTPSRRGTSAAMKDERQKQLNETLGAGSKDLNVLGNYDEDVHDGEFGDEYNGEERDDQEENEEYGDEVDDDDYDYGIIEDDQTAIPAPQQQEQQQQKQKANSYTAQQVQRIRSLPRSRGKEKLYQTTEDASSPRSLRSNEDRSRASARSSRDEQSNQSRRSAVNSANRSRSKSKTRKVVPEPTAKKAIRNMLHGLRAKVQKA
jgi:hypothetical protein